MSLKITDADRSGHIYVQWMFALIANILSISLGFESGWTSPTTKILQSASSPTGAALSNNTISWVASAMNIGAVAGVLTHAYIADKWGRKLSVMLLALPQTLSWAIRIAYTSVPTLIIARALGGFAAGGAFNVIPVYVKEISQDNIRGVLGSLLIFGQNVGIFIMYAIGAYLEYYTVMYLVVWVPVLGAMLMIKAPESPAFLVKHGKIQEATKTVAFLRGRDVNDKLVQSEVDYMKKVDEDFKSQPEISMMTILKDKSWRYGLFLIFVTITLQATNGSISIITYASAILISTGVEFDISPELQTLSIPTVMIIASFTLTLLIERCGRKMIYAGACLISVGSMMALGLAVLLQQMGFNVASWLPVVAMVVSVAMYAGGISPLIYIIMAEMFSFRVRAKIMGTIISYAWFMTFVTISMYSPIVNTFGIYSIFFIYAVVNLIAAVFVLTLLPETKGKSEEVIREELLGKKVHEEISG